MRLLACITIQPHINPKKGKLTPEKLLPFPWDRDGITDETLKPTKEEQRKRMEELVKKLGDELI